MDRPSWMQGMILKSELKIYLWANLIPMSTEIEIFYSWANLIDAIEHVDTRAATKIITLYEIWSLMSFSRAWATFS